MKNWFKCCVKSRSVSRDEYTPDVESNGSIENLSMISVTYGLESFNKNAMLLFCQVISSQGSRDRDVTMDQVALLRDSFQKYRFEVETHVDLSSSEIEEKSDNFFARDFSEYGAVAVVILSPGGRSGELAASDKMFHESLVLKHFTTHVPMTLRGKPKIYITEANRQSSQANQETLDEETNVYGNDSHNRVSMVIEDCYEDILAFHIPSIIEDGARSPLRIFCDRMNASEDHGNLIGIIIGSMEDIEENIPDLKEKLELFCTFKKRFTLPMFVLLE